MNDEGSSPDFTKRIVPVSVMRQGEGTSILYSDGTQIWLQGGSYHRTDGPAVLKKNGEKKYFLNGKACPDYVKTDEDLMLYMVHM